MAEPAGLPGTGDAVSFQSLCDRAKADAGIGELEDPLYDRRGLRVGLEGPEVRARRGFGPVGVGEAGID